MNVAHPILMLTYHVRGVKKEHLLEGKRLENGIKSFQTVSGSLLFLPYTWRQNATS